jgi:hypothetical protein
VDDLEKRYAVCCVGPLHILKGLKLRRVLVPSFLLFFPTVRLKVLFYSVDTTLLVNNFLSFLTATFLGFYI